MSEFGRWARGLRGDLRYGARMLAKGRGVTIVAIVSLTLGIGANVALFSLVNALLIRPRAVAGPERLVHVYAGDRQQPYQPFSYPSYLDLRDRNGLFSGLAAFSVGWQFRLTGADDVELVWGEAVSADYFDVLGVRAYRGRTFAPEEGAAPGRDPVAVIGHALWQRRFASDPGVIGRTVVLNGKPVTVIGVAPPQYTGMVGGWASEVWVPTMLLPSLVPSRGSALLTHRGNRWVTLVGRLRPGVTIEQARAWLATFTRAMQAEQPREWMRADDGGRVRELFVSIVPERDARVHPQLRPIAYAMVALLGVVINLVLAIACMNLAGMLLARGVARRNEIAVRIALGASRGRIVRQLLAESVLLAFIAGGAGVLLAAWALHALVAYMPALPEGIRVTVDARLDWRVALFAIACSAVTGMLFGLAPALHASRSDVSSVLKDDAAAAAGSFHTSRARRVLIVAQVALSVVLLIGAGLVLRSLERLRPTRLGFATERIVVAPIALDEETYDRARSNRFYRRLSEDLAGAPGVEAVTLVEYLPGGFLGRTRRSTEIEGYAPRPDESLEIDATIVGPRYFTTMRVPILAGRDFEARDQDGAPCVAIVNEAFARRYLAGSAAALGKHLARYEGSRDRKELCEIVGVVRDDAWQALQAAPHPWFALPLLQSDERRTTLLVHAAGDPGSVVPSVRRAIRALDPNVPVTDVQSLGEHFGVALYPFRLVALVLGGCGLAALLLATIGIYGTVAYAVAQRRRELGIRMALGALRADILRLVVGQGMGLMARGLALGLLLGVALTAALAAVPLETDVLFGVSATDALTYGGVTLLLALVSLGACYFPALAATRVDPLAALRGRL